MSSFFTNLRPALGTHFLRQRYSLSTRHRPAAGAALPYINLATASGTCRPCTGWWGALIVGAGDQLAELALPLLPLRYPSDLAQVQNLQTHSSLTLGDVISGLSCPKQPA